MNWVFAAVLSLGLSPVEGLGRVQEDNLSALVGVLKEVDDPQFQLDILRGIRDGLKGRPNVPMPKGWAEVSPLLAKSPNAEVRALAQALSTTFGDVKALEGLRAVLADAKAAVEARKNALDSLLGTRDAGLPPLLLALLADPALRGAAIRGLATYQEPGTPGALLKVYATLDVSEQRDVIATLASRKDFARALIEALRGKTVPRTDLTAATIRQLKEHGDAEIDSWIDKEWGVARATPEDRLKLIAQYKEKVKAGPKGDPSKGRLLFSKTCNQCHTLFEPGGRVGPELTGANRQDLDYLFSNILDPSAVIGKDYQATLIRLKSDRIVTGIVKSETKDAVTMLTENDTLVIPLGEISARRTAEVSMMPEGLLAALGDADVLNLIAYLQSFQQVPLPQGAATELFNGKDLTGWEGDPAIWSVENGELVGKGTLKKNAFLFSKLEVSDFRLTFEVKITGTGGFINSGFQVRSVPHGGHEAKGPQCDIGPGWWGKLYEESARGLLFPPKGQKFDGDKFVKPYPEWNVYEIVAVGSKLRTAINGNLCTDLDDEKLAKSGRFAPQVHDGGKDVEVRFRNFKLELNPEFKLMTVKE
jgi:putative heme-binding domain-containing protein